MSFFDRQRAEGNNGTMTEIGVSQSQLVEGGRKFPQYIAALSGNYSSSTYLV